MYDDEDFEKISKLALQQTYKELLEAKKDSENNINMVDDNTEEDIKRLIKTVHRNYMSQKMENEE